MRTKERTKGKTKESPSAPYSSPADAMKGGVGRNSSDSSPAPQHLRLHPVLLFPLLALPELPCRRLAPRVGFLFHRRHYSSHVCCEKFQCRLTASPIGEEIPDPPPALLPPCLLPHFRPEDLLLPLPLGTFFKEMDPCLQGALAPPALRVRPFLGPMQVLSCFFFFFFLFIHYSCVTYLDHDEGRAPICTIRFPAAVRV